MPKIFIWEKFFGDKWCDRVSEVDKELGERKESKEVGLLLRSSCCDFLTKEEEDDEELSNVEVDEEDDDDEDERIRSFPNKDIFYE